MRKHPAALSCASRSGGIRRPASISALRALIEGARSRTESRRVSEAGGMAPLGGAIEKTNTAESYNPAASIVETFARLRRLLGLLAACVAATFRALSPRRTLGLVSRLVAASTRHDVAGGQHFDELAHCRRQLAAALVYDRKRAEKGAFLEFEHPQGAARHFVLDRHPRHDCASQPNLDGALDGLDVVELEHVSRLDAVLAQDSIRGLARRNVAFVADELLTLQLSDVHLRVLGQRIVGRHGEHQLVMAKRHRNYLAALGRIGHDAEIDLTLDEVFVNFVRAQVLEMHVHGRIVAQKFRQVRRQLMQANAVNGTDANRPCPHRANLTQPVFQFQKSAHDFLARRVENLPGRRGFDSGSPAFYQSAVVLLFQASDLLADRRLSDEVLRRGIRKASALDYVAEDL